MFGAGEMGEAKNGDAGHSMVFDLCLCCALTTLLSNPLITAA